MAGNMSDTAARQRILVVDDEKSICDADEALYTSKTRGKNRFTVHQ